MDMGFEDMGYFDVVGLREIEIRINVALGIDNGDFAGARAPDRIGVCLLYTSPSPRD